VRLVLDASVAAKWFNTEELSEEAIKVKDAHVSGDVDLTAPTHIIYEVGNSICMNRQLTHEDTSDAIVSLLRLDIQLLPPTIERASRAIKIARQKKITFYDAAYLQAAEEQDVALLTADKRQATAAEGIVKIVHLHEAKLRF